MQLRSLRAAIPRIIWTPNPTSEIQKKKNCIIPQCNFTIAQNPFVTLGYPNETSRSREGEVVNTVMFTPDNNNHLRHHVIFTFHDCIESQKGEMEYMYWQIKESMIQEVHMIFNYRDKCKGDTATCIHHDMYSPVSIGSYISKSFAYYFGCKHEG